MNTSFPKKCVYHIGYDAGFFSEYNNMILGMLYCLRNRIRFTLYSKDALFKTVKGWTDYFLPFCPEETNRLHSFLNLRPYPRKTDFIRKPIENLFKRTQGGILLTSDIWLPMRELSADTRRACRQLVDITWRYTSQTQEEVSRLIRSLDMPADYVGLHIRGGDKSREMELKELDLYMNKLASLSDIKNLFVLTDDYRVIEDIRKSYPQYAVYTLCGKSERGYYHRQFGSMPAGQKRRQMLNLFASVDILATSRLFIGTYSSNPGMYLGMRMEEEKTFGIDLPEWTIW